MILKNIQQNQETPVKITRNGELAENIAAELVSQQQHIILARNFHSRFGEIDIICQQREYLVFIEVRHRTSSHWGGALQSVSEKKQNKIIKTAGQFLVTHPKYAYSNCRFDVISFQQDVSLANAQWIKNAFTL